MRPSNRERRAARERKREPLAPIPVDFAPQVRRRGPMARRFR